MGQGQGPQDSSCESWGFFPLCPDYCVTPVLQKDKILFLSNWDFASPLTFCSVLGLEMRSIK